MTHLPSHGDPDDALRPPQPPAWVQERFKDALLREQLVTETALQAAVHRSAERNIALHESAIGLGLVDERTAYALLADAAGLRFADLRVMRPSPLARHLVPTSLLTSHEVFPVAVDDRQLRYVTATPCDAAADRAVSMATGRATAAILVCRSDLRAVLARGEQKRTSHPTRRQHAPGPRLGVEPVRHTVLIVDDDATTRTLVRLLLERDGYRVCEASNGRQALDRAARHEVDLIVMDLVMPELDGYGAILELRRQPRHVTTPIIVVTTEEGPAVEQRVVALGADDYILKPFEPTVLISRVTAAFRRRRVEAW